MNEANDGSMIGIIMFMAIAGVYIYFAYAQYRIALKANHSSPWMAWIPIANTIQLIDLAGKQWFWILLLLVPFVNIICFGMLWAEAAKRINHAPVWGWLTIVPFLNFVSIGVMAFGSGSYEVSGHRPPPSNQPEQKHEPQEVR